MQTPSEFLFYFFQIDDSIWQNARRVNATDKQIQFKTMNEQCHSVTMMKRVMQIKKEKHHNQVKAFGKKFIFFCLLNKHEEKNCNLVVVLDIKKFIIWLFIFLKFFLYFFIGWHLYRVSNNGFISWGHFSENPWTNLLHQWWTF